MINITQVKNIQATKDDALKRAVDAISKNISSELETFTENKIRYTIKDNRYNTEIKYDDLTTIQGNSSNEYLDNVRSVLNDISRQALDHQLDGIDFLKILGETLEKNGFQVKYYENTDEHLYHTLEISWY